ncbi:universal stress protein [Kutzneria buriramensis]|uniref:Nucleotide-binding universal stress UspA family protein n=1 Tax=Kutzneria buriramensis TaxID=1045776 RepID=A0A3E0GY77_9PSEU|nr:universal stress protein [Kutzneria buriramensis]REH34879.1 nucleotide-binding universal stress UspA family protein [Kutzneria buriramensis]
MIKDTPGPDPVVVGVDGSESAAHAVRWAAKEAELTSSPLSIVHATALDAVYVPASLPLPRPYHQAVLEIGQQYLAAAAAQAQAVTPKVEVGVRLSRASAAPALIGLSSAARLVVVGSRGLGGFTGLLVGSTAVAVAAHGHCPLVVVRGDEPDAAVPIVAGADGSVESDAALALAFQAAELRDVPLVVVHACPDTIVESAWHEAAIGADWQHVADAQVAAHRTRHPDVEVRPLVVRHGPARALLHEAARAQLVVVGSRGRGGFRGLLLGSTSQALIHHSPCPVAVVPARR